MKALAGEPRRGVAELSRERANVARLRANGSRQGRRRGAFSANYGNFATRTGACRGPAGALQPSVAARAAHPRRAVAHSDLLDIAICDADAEHCAVGRRSPRTAHSDPRRRNGAGPRLLLRHPFDAPTATDYTEAADRP